MSGRQFRAQISKVFSRVLDPGLCIGCGQAIRPLQHFCVACAEHLVCIVHPCYLCGLTIKIDDASYDQPVCAACLYDPPRWQKMIAPLLYREFSRSLLIQLKFNDSLYLANCLVSHLIEYFRQNQPQPEVLIPVPLHQNRLIHRGYNQAFEIAHILSTHLSIPVDTQALKRIRYTTSQLGLSANQRQNNMRQAFHYESISQYSHVAVIDDIITTGSTANEITKVLNHGGVSHVEVWGLARVSK